MNKDTTDWYMVFWCVVMGLAFAYSFAKWWYCF